MYTTDRYRASPSPHVPRPLPAPVQLARVVGALARGGLTSDAIRRFLRYDMARAASSGLSQAAISAMNSAIEAAGLNVGGGGGGGRRGRVGGRAGAAGLWAGSGLRHYGRGGAGVLGGAVECGVSVAKDLRISVF